MRSAFFISNFLIFRDELALQDENGADLSYS